MTTDKSFEETTQPDPQEELVSSETTEEEIEVPDYKAQYEALQSEQAAAKQQIAKLENDLRSQRGSRQRQADITQELADVKALVGGMQEGFTALAKAMASGETEGVDSKLADISRRHAVSSGERVFVAFNDEQWARMEGKNQDAEGNSLLDLHTAPEFAEVRQMWAEAQRNRDRAGIALALAEATTVLGKVERQKMLEARKAEKRTPKAPSLDTGPGAGGGLAVTVDNIDALYAKDPGKYGNAYAKFRASGWTSVS